MAVEQRLAEHLPRSEEVPAADQRSVLPVRLMAVVRAPERLPLQTTLTVEVVVARPAERLADFQFATSYGQNASQDKIMYKS